MLLDETIAALSTPPGAGAIAVVRLSGQAAWAITEKIFSRQQSFGASGFQPLKRQRAAHGFIFHPDTKQLIDEVVVVAFKGPNSYTGEDLVEISCHGSPFITKQLLDLLMRQGARLARAGEFTQRAFLNGRLDLTQAEAVLDLIQSATGRQSSQALSALGGEIGDKIKGQRDRLIELLSRIVAGIDFPDEVGETPLDDIEQVVASSIATLDGLAQTVRSGRFLRQGLRLAIVGKPNAGKSSLLNQLLKFERAIVTDIPGTTRDSLEEMLDLRGIPVLLVDTAGIRDTADQVEKIGIERTYKALAQADLILMVCDLESGWNKDDELIAKMLDEKPHIVLANKCDLTTDNEAAVPIAAKLGKPAEPGLRLAVLPISAKLGVGIEALGQIIESWVFADERSRDAGASLNARQGELCLRAIEALSLVQETMQARMPQDCLATDLKTTVDSLSEICGEAVSEEIITNVFANFCIGK